jgi:hypothetical protein
MLSAASVENSPEVAAAVVQSVAPIPWKSPIIVSGALLPLIGKYVRSVPPSPF